MHDDDDMIILAIDREVSFAENLQDKKTVENNKQQLFHMKYPMGTIYNVTETKQTILIENKRDLL